MHFENSAVSSQTPRMVVDVGEYDREKSTAARNKAQHLNYSSQNKSDAPAGTRSEIKTSYNSSNSRSLEVIRIAQPPPRLCSRVVQDRGEGAGPTALVIMGLLGEDGHTLF